ncbi:MAG: YqgE/AlgH family protein [Gammaproteobacteria bacterium]
MQTMNLTNQFLIAMPRLLDPNFFQTVTYIFSHDENGAMGIVINRPLKLDLGEILAQMDLPTENRRICSLPVYDGGPVNTDRGFIIHEPDTVWQSTIKVSDDVAVTTSRDILEAFANGSGPDKAFIALGYAGWGAGQLEQELTDNSWLNAPSGADLIFDTPFDKRWEFAVELLGIKMQNLSSQIGHA